MEIEMSSFKSEHYIKYVILKQGEGT